MVGGRIRSLTVKKVTCSSSQQHALHAEEGYTGLAMARVLKGGLRDGKKVEIDPFPFDPRAEAKKIIAEAKHEAERLRNQAVVEGRERGLASVTELLTVARVQTMRTQREIREDLRVLAVRIAERILGRELAQNPDVVLDLVGEALSQAGAPREVVVRCHPDDLKALERGRPRLIERCARAHAVVFRTDPTIARGSCVVETELGTIDARLPTQLDAIERALRGSNA